MCSLKKTVSLSNWTRVLLVRRYMQTKSGVSSREIRKFDNLASQWWDESGPFKALHSFNKVRVPWIVENLDSKVNSPEPLKGLRLLEVGCGGGILTEPLCRLGAAVTAVDLSAQSVAVAESRLSLPGNETVKQNVSYLLSSVEEVAHSQSQPISAGSSGSGFDAVILSEVIEHNEDQQGLIRVCGSVLRPGGKLFVTTLNKTLAAYVFGIVAAEYVLGIVPAGTHEHDKFVSPEELRQMMRSCGLEVVDTKGLLYNPVCNSWSWSDYFEAINYACVGMKPVPDSEQQLEDGHRSS